MTHNIEELILKLTDNLKIIKEIENPLEKLISATDAIDQTIKDLNQLLKEHTFPDELQEVRFFKEIKPKILAMGVEEAFRYNLSVNKPIGTNEIQQKYYEEELRALQSFFRMNSFHYQYYKNGLATLDTIYFLRSAGPLPVPLAEIAQTDTEFSTPMCYLFAKFIAYENVQYFILEQIATLKYPDLDQINKAKDNIEDLKWTGESINIVELAYGIWLTGQLNNGNASLNHIVRWLEVNLHINIGIVQRRFTEIERRKRLSPTKYIDKMKETIMQKIESDNS